MDKVQLPKEAIIGFTVEQMQLLYAGVFEGFEQFHPLMNRLDDATIIQMKLMSPKICTAFKETFPEAYQEARADIDRILNINK